MQSNEEEVGGSAGLEWRKASGKSPARDQSAIVQYKRWLRWKTRSAMVVGGGEEGMERKGNGSARIMEKRNRVKFALYRAL